MAALGKHNSLPRLKRSAALGRFDIFNRLHRKGRERISQFLRLDCRYKDYSALLCLRVETAITLDIDDCSALLCLCLETAILHFSPQRILSNSKHTHPIVHIQPSNPSPTYIPILRSASSIASSTYTIMCSFLACPDYLSCANPVS